MFDNLTTSLPFHGSKRVTILATATKERLPALPDVPTMAEAACPISSRAPGSAWWGRGTPARIVDQISHDVAETLKQPEVDVSSPCSAPSLSVADRAPRRFSRQKAPSGRRSSLGPGHAD